MIALRRTAALFVALVISSFPLALERCRAACIEASAPVETAPAAHGCHQPAATDQGPSISPSSRACGHGDDVRIADATLIAAAKVRADFSAVPAAMSLPVDLSVAIAGPAAPDPPRLSSPGVSRNLPLRL